MEIEQIVNLISSVGFPIFACIYLFKLLQDLQNTLADISKALTLMDERISKIETYMDDGGDKP